MTFRHKKSFGQHFLNDKEVAERIAGSLPKGDFECVVEVGPGQGVLTKHLLKMIDKPLYPVEIDRRLAPELRKKFPEIASKVIEADFLKLDLKEQTRCGSFAVIGNFPYNISSQIVFKVLEERERIPVMVGMFQEEVARRLISKGGNKDYGILSVLVNTWYESEYLFDVSSAKFDPPPKVESGVIRMIRKEGYELPCDESGYRRVVKTAFNQRRKTLNNSLKGLGVEIPEQFKMLRPEQLGVEQFIELAMAIEKQLP